MQFYIVLAVLLVCTGAASSAANESHPLALQNCAQSSIHGNHVCDFAIDGDLTQSTNWAHLEAETTGWWRAQTARFAHIQVVRIYNRDTVQERLNNFAISVDGVQCASYRSDTSFSVRNFPCNGSGLTVKISSNLPYLTLCEVQVFGKYADPLALQNCAQSSIHGNHVCGFAIDGDLTQSTNWAHLEAEPAGWWRAQTARFAHIQVVRIYNRDTVQERLNNFAISVDGVQCASYRSDTAFSVRNFPCNGYGRTVKISSNLPYLTLCEVQVFGEYAAPPKHEQFPDQSCSSMTSAEASTQVATGSEEACKMQCVALGTCKYFAFMGTVCKLSSLPYGMTFKLVGKDTDSCREVCVGLRRFCIFQQRLDGSVAFNRSWDDYVNGFGNERNFWSGLVWLNRITSTPDKLIFRAELTDWGNRMFAAEYSGFVVQGASTNYTMDYDAFLSSSSVTSDSLQSNKKRQFSTTDRDNDEFGASCSNVYHGGAGWWFGGCTVVNPNGVMAVREEVNTSALYWHGVHYNENSLKSARLLIQKP